MFDILLADGSVFRSDGNPTDLYGWVEDTEHRIVSGQSGWFRTGDIYSAARIAAHNLGTTVSDYDVYVNGPRAIDHLKIDREERSSEYYIIHNRVTGETKYSNKREW